MDIFAKLITIFSIRETHIHLKHPNRVDCETLLALVNLEAKNYVSFNINIYTWHLHIFCFKANQKGIIKFLHVDAERYSCILDSL